MILFIKTPEKGMVKSRLASAIGEDRAVVFYRAFILDMIGALKKGNHPLIIAFYPENSGEAVTRWLGNDFEYVPQRGTDLGERMGNAFRYAFSCGFERTVLIGSDIPDLPSEVIDEAFSALEEYDAVIGPAADGGYYLIGFRKSSFLPEIFRDIVWSADSVYETTVRIFEEARVLPHILPEWKDVDTLDDLRSLYTRNRETAFRESSTMSFCRSVFHDQEDPITES